MKALAVFASIVTLLFVGCSSKSSKDLTRNVAKSVIESDKDFKDDGVLKLTEADVENGVKAGYWVRISPVMGGIELTSEGHKYFKSVNLAVDGYSVNCVEPAKPYVVEITGITEAPQSVDGNLRIVEAMIGAKFEGQMRNITKVIQITPEKAEIVLRRYDDGWRVQKE